MNDLAKALSDAELHRLSAFLSEIKNPDALSIEGMDGLFCALIAGPDTVMPSEYMPLAWGGELPDENAFESMQQAQDITSMMIRHWNTVIEEFEQEKVYCPLLDEDDEKGVPGRQWARGFMRGVHARLDGWRDMIFNENEGQLLAIPLIAGEIDPDWPTSALSKDKRDELESWLAVGAARAYRHYQTQRTLSVATPVKATYRREGVKVGLPSFLVQ